MSSSLVDLIHENEGDEFPFQRLEPTQPPSPSSGSSSSDVTPPYLARTLPSPGSSSPSSSRHHRRRRDDRHRDAADAEGETSAKLLSRLVSRFDQRDVKHIRTLLILTNDRLDSETRRADQAEQRAVDALHRLRSAHEATALAQMDTTRAKQEVHLFQMRLDQADREIKRAQELVDQLEQARKEAEEEAARARSVARKCREQLLSSKAREEGRKEGYAEGLARGRALALSELGEGVSRKRSTSSRPPLRAVRPSARDVDEAYARDDSGSSESISPVPISTPSRRAEPPRPSSVPVPAVHRATPPPFHDFRSKPPSVRSSSPMHVPDIAPIASLLPIPTLVTPLNAPSPSHNRPPPPQHQQSSLHPPSPKKSQQPRPASPQPLPVPPPASTSPHDPVPISIHNAPPSPSHPPVDIPPDGWIPYAANNDSSSILLPPPHELSRPVSPVPSTENGTPRRSSPRALPVPPPETRYAAPSTNINSMAQDRRHYSPSVRSRDYASRGAGASRKPPSTSMNSPQSRQSTISHYDLLGPPRHEMVYRQGVDRESLMAGQGPPDRPVEVRTVHRIEEDDDNRSMLEKMFTKRYKSRRSPDKGKGKERDTVPVVLVESPTTPNSSSSRSSINTHHEPHLLSPEHAHHILPTLTDVLSPPDSQSPRMVPPPLPPKQVPYREALPMPGPSRYQPTPPYRSTTPAVRPYSPYMEAPVPQGVVYPAPPGRPRSVTSGGSAPLSPISLGKPFSSFAASDR